MQKIEFSWKTPKNIPIFACEWKPVGPVKAVIVLVHGIGEHIGRYEHVAQMFTDNHYAFLGADLIGHGKSGGQRGHVDAYDEYLEIIDWLLLEAHNRYPGLPQFIYGHSLGGNLALYYSQKRSPRIAGMIVSSPGLEPTNVPPLKLALGKLMYALYPRFKMTNSLDVTGLSRDDNVIAAYQADPMVHPFVSARLGIDLLSTGKVIRENGGETQIPLLMLHGQQDRLVKIAGTREYASHRTGDVTFIEIPQGYHELHNEPNKQEIFQIWLAWLDKVLNVADK